MKAAIASDAKRAKHRERLMAFNWLQTPEAIKKNREVRIARGTDKGRKLLIHGGNGKGMTVPQSMLADALQWPVEFVVKTGATKGDGRPFHYKLDIAHPLLKVAVEVDGRSHRSMTVRQSDARKDLFLKSSGWTVLRFSNQQVMDDLAGCVQMVLSTTSRLMETTTSSPKES
jgi:hypothetical protein